MPRRSTLPAEAKSFHRPRKRFGQHFLVRRDVAERIVSLADLHDDEAVLEIGPGRGALTRLLAARSAPLWLVEIDRDLVAELRASFASQPHVHVVEADILDVDLDRLLGADAPLKVVANLPYNISTPLLFRLLEHAGLFSRLVLMVQWEVAERLTAAPGDRAYSPLTVMAQLRSTVRFALRVPGSAFSPPPKVESAVVVVEPTSPPRLGTDELANVRRLVRQVFSMRRKQLANALHGWVGDPVGLLRRLDIDPQRRPGTLSLDEIVALARGRSVAADAPADA